MALNLLSLRGERQMLPFGLAARSRRMHGQGVEKGGQGTDSMSSIQDNMLSTQSIEGENLGVGFGAEFIKGMCQIICNHRSGGRLDGRPLHQEY